MKRPQLPPDLAARARPVSTAAVRLLPLSAPLGPLFPDGALRRGTTTVVTGVPGLGATTLALALLAAPSTSGSWCGIVGLADPGVAAMAELGIDLSRVVLVPRPRGGWAEAVGELLGGVDVLLVRPPGSCRAPLARRLAARSRERRTALVVLVDRVGDWPEAPDLVLRAAAASWRGVGRGHGYLRGRLAEVQVVGRRSADRTTSCRLWLPSGTGCVAAVAAPAPADPEPAPAPEPDTAPERVAGAVSGVG
ncbi:MAG TPA: hypothetical protein VMU76_04100 [Acidimicrobiales bacterium]|nr:hypothetical protein [Acidimicrobiales bacterium]